MSCTRRLKAWRAVGGGITFDASMAFRDMPIELPCGQCMHCRLRKKRDWAIRMMHENSQHERSSFLTLTYSDENLPHDLGLDKRHWQLFAKKLRNRVGPFRYFHVGEYGEENLRPHYHAIVFGHNFSFDRYQVDTTDGGHPLYNSPTLDSLWDNGFAVVAEVTFDSVAYCAKYVTKKLSNPEVKDLRTAKAKYLYEESVTRIDPNTGEVWQVAPEYATMSRRPGIGSDWYEKYKGETYRDDFVVQKGRKFRPPRYYDKKYGEDHEREFAELCRARAERAIRLSTRSDQHDDRYRELALERTLKHSPKGKL